MQRRLWVQSGAWALATCASVAVSWFGVHTVVAGTVYDPPRAMTVPEQSGAEPQASSTHRPKPSASPSGSPSDSPSPSPPPSSARPPAERHSQDPGNQQQKPSGGERDERQGSGQSGHVESATVQGGRVVFDMGEHSASLVSATPDSGWDMQVWNTDEWIRVTFTQGGKASSVFCRWDESAPRIERFEG